MNSEARYLSESVGAVADLHMRSGYATSEQIAAANQRHEQYEVRQRRGRSSALRDICNTRKRFYSASLDDEDLPSRVLSVEDFKRWKGTRDYLRAMLSTPATVVLSGSNGPGKTHLASGLVHAFCDQLRPAHFCAAMEFYASVKSTFGADGRTQEDLIRRFRRYHLLVLDELEVRNDSGWENSLLRYLVCRRHDDVLSTILLTNKSPRELDGRDDGSVPYLDSAIRSRMQDAGGIVFCNWSSLRGKK